MGAVPILCVVSPIRSPPVYTLQSTLTCGVWSVEGSRDVLVDALRVEVGNVLHSTCCVFPVHPRLTYESYSCRRGLGVRCCVREIFSVDSGGEGLETHERF